MSKHDLKKIIWLASYPKSGNTWLRIFLENVLNPTANCDSINKLNYSSNASSRTLIDNHAGISSANLTNNEIEDLRPRVYFSLAEHSDEQLFLKVHDAWKNTHSGKPMFPSEITKGVIYLVRNPLDIAVSFSYHSSKSLDATIRNINSKEYAFCRNPTKNYQQVKQILSDWSSHIVGWIDNSGLPMLVLRYEDMLENPSTSFRKVLNFIDIKVSEKEFQKALRASKINVLKEMEKKEGFVEKPIGMKAFFREGKSGSWKEHLNASQQREICDMHQIQMKRFSYFPIS